MKIILDDEPKTFVPLEVDDYSSLLLCCFLYQPLFIKSKSGFSENIIIDKSINKEVILEFKEVYWSDGSPLLPEDFKKTLLYILNSRSYLANYLSFIVGVEEYLNDDVKLNDIGIYTENKNIHIKTKTDDNYYKYVFSTIYFSPVKIKNGKVCENITCGKYFLNKNTYELFPNKYNKPSINEKILLVFNDNVNQNLEEFSKGNIDMTSTTLIYRKNKQQIEEMEEFNSKTSNLLLRVEFRDNLSFLRKEVSELLEKFIKSDSYLNDDMRLVSRNVSNNILEESLVTEKHISILYADYYPNNHIAYVIQEFLKEKQLEVDMVTGDFDFFLKEHKKNEYNIVIDILSSITNSYIDYFIEKMSYFEEEYIDEYIDNINLWINGSIEIDELYKFIDKYSRIIEIGFLKHNYLLNQKYKGKIYIDDNDNFIIN